MKNSLAKILGKQKKMARGSPDGGPGLFGDTATIPDGAQQTDTLTKTTGPPASAAGDLADVRGGGVRAAEATDRQAPPDVAGCRDVPPAKPPPWQVNPADWLDVSEDRPDGTRRLVLVRRDRAMAAERSRGVALADGCEEHKSAPVAGGLSPAMRAALAGAGGGSRAAAVESAPF